ncbi:MAG: ABC transporter permease [Anaerolineae bacterium]|nr:ABC transporter permease [Anaerolineae bacterium]
MRSLWKLTWVEAKLFLREPAGAFFTLAFPVLVLLLFGSIYGNRPTELFGGLGTIDVSVPGYAAMIIGTTGLMGLPTTLASYREKGVLRRLGATPLRPHVVLVAHMLVLFGMTLLGMALLIGFGKVIYGLHFGGNPLSVALAFVLACLSFFALGFLLGSLMPSARSTQIVSMVVFYPMLFLSGAGMPRELLSESIRRFSVVLPLTHVVTLLRGLWAGDPWSRHWSEVVILAAILLAGTAVSARIFRWE